MSTARRSIRFCFDFVSPYAYLAWTQIHALAERHGAEVVPTPVVFGVMLDANGQKGPAEIAAKRAYLFKNCVRLAAGFGVPFAPPPAHPFNPLLPLRAASLPMAEDVRRTLIDRLYVEAWGGGRGLADAAVVADVARSVGLDGDAIVAAASAPEAKDRLRRQTEEALAAGVFGVPTAIVDGEVFWGVDSLPHVARFLDGDDPVTPELVARWATLPSTATRRGARAS